jgi:putative phage-type endonuclease
MNDNGGALATPERTQLLAERATGLGGSDAASLFNEGYGCRRRLWYEKTGMLPDYEEDRPVMRRGRKLEDLVAEEYALATGRSVATIPVMRHPDYDFLIVHIDRMTVEAGSPNPIPLEIKTMGREAFYRLKRSGPPVDYILQLQWALMLTGQERGAFAFFWPDGWQLIHLDIMRDDDICIRLVAEAMFFWNSLNCPDSIPDRLDPGDRRCQNCKYRTSCQGEAILTAAKAAPVDGDIPYDISLGSLVREYQELATISKEADELLDNCKGRIKHAIGDHAIIDAPGARIYHTASTIEAFTVRKHVRRPLRIFPR